MRLRINPLIFWFLTTIASIGIGFWWVTQNLPNGPREQAAFGLLIVAALAFRVGMVHHR